MDVCGWMTICGCVVAVCVTVDSMYFNFLRNRAKRKPPGE